MEIHQSMQMLIRAKKAYDHQDDSKEYIEFAKTYIFHQHNVVQSNSRMSSTLAQINTISKEKKSRLDHLLKLVTFEDGRSGDFRKSGVMKFSAEALPGEEHLLGYLVNIGHALLLQRIEVAMS